MSTPTVKFDKHYDVTRRTRVYVILNDQGMATAETYRDGDGWKLEDYTSGQVRTGVRRGDVVAAMIAARRIREEIDLEWDKILEGNTRSKCFITTAETCMISAEANADECGIERHSDEWCDMVLCTYNDCMDRYYAYGDAVYTRNIDEDIDNGLMEAL